MKVRQIRRAASHVAGHKLWRATEQRGSRMSRRPRCQSTGSQDQGGSALQHKARQLLEDSPEALERLQAVDEAAAVVARLQEERAKVERAMQAQAASSSSDKDNEEQAAKRDALIRDVQEALQDMADARQSLASAQFEKSQIQGQIDRDADRIESAKAGAVAAVGGLLAELPFALSGNGSTLTLAFVLGSAALSAALLGIVLRYATRENWSDGQLKQGVVLAFGFTRGLAQLPLPQNFSLQNTDGLIQFASQGLLSVGTSVLVFGCAAAAVQAAVVSKVLQPCRRTPDDA